MSRVKPILFNTDMVRASLDGRKTVTRRCMKPQPQGYFEVNEEPLYIYDTSLGQGQIHSPYQPGDILYVRETWHKYTKRVGTGECCHMAEFYGYKASIANSEEAGERWKPSIHMPKEAARLWLKVTDARVERLQDITNKDVEKEGVEKKCIDSYIRQMPCETEEYIRLAYIIAFQDIWDSIIKKKDLLLYGWNANPWVWVIEFEQCKKTEEI